MDGRIGYVPWNGGVLAEWPNLVDGFMTGNGAPGLGTRVAPGVFSE